MRSKVKKEKNVRSKVKRKTGVVAARPREGARQILRRGLDRVAVRVGEHGRMMDDTWLKEKVRIF